MPQPDLPLAGIRVLDLTQILAGPYCTMMLGDLGADVVKVERPDGDGTRRWGPPFAGEESAYFLQVNRNKRSIAIDLKDPDGAAVAQRLAARADVVIENFLPGAVERFGLDHETVKATNPGVVHCAIRGFPTGHPDAARPGYDFVMQGIGGIMSMQGEPAGEPMKVAVAISDIVAGQFAAAGIMGALVRRGRTGEGGTVEVSLLDAQVAWLANRAGDWLIGGVEPARLGNAHPSIVPYETFHASDGHINLAVGNDAQFARFCREAGRDDLADDADFATNPLRVLNRERLVAALGETIATQPVAYWVDVLERASVPGRAGARAARGLLRAGGARRRGGRPPHRRAAAPGGDTRADRRRAARRAHASTAPRRARSRDPGRGRLHAGRGLGAARRALRPRVNCSSARMWRNW